MGRKMNAQNNSESEYVKAVYEWVFATSFCLDIWITIIRRKKRGYTLYVIGLFLKIKYENENCVVQGSSTSRWKHEITERLQIV